MLFPQLGQAKGLSWKGYLMRKCDGCGKRRANRDLLTCNCCDGRFCIVDNLSGTHNGGGADTCADRHEAGY